MDGRSTTNNPLNLKGMYTVLLYLSASTPWVLYQPALTLLHVLNATSRVP